MNKFIDIEDIGRIEFRPMAYVDVPDVYRVECKAYEFPWTENLFSDCVRVGYQCYVLEFLDNIIGYAIFRVQFDEGHLFNIAVDPDYQNKGLGHAFLGLIITQMKLMLVHRVILEVRESNYPARKVYDDYGFKPIGIREGYYPGPNQNREDGIVLELYV